ncbi:hypothetical protein CO666_18830 [Rhizobium chutanense]|uniref:Uncharacterized protein n=1 Tax=Rhizobium chutanense TaxID=2035448 RepID=A0A2A6J9T1_9HYPH|nr:hypothetical protein [Rhizobium chutanense]PDT02623.1 hypothetical protein CO666_18830 [Rhizobium chutanense]
MCKPNGKTGIPAACPRRGDCRGCLTLSATLGAGSASHLDALIKEERPPPALILLETFSIQAKIKRI